jgi:tetratricopeptide (TPR) repeat protein
LRSDPPAATVFPVDAEGRRGAPLGNTPVTFSATRLAKYTAVEIKRDGYEAKALVIPAINADNIEMGVRLTPIDETWIRQRFQKEQARTLSSQFVELLKLQNAILQRSDNEVEMLEDAMKKDFSEISAWHSMLGNHYFLKGNKAKAQIYYKRAFELDPNNNEAKVMLRNLRKIEK